MSTKLDDPLHPIPSTSMENFNYKSIKDYAVGRERQKQRPQMWCINGEYVTSSDIASRLQVDVKKARFILAKAAKLPGATTWAVLESLNTRKGKAQ